MSLSPANSNQLSCVHVSARTAVSSVSLLAGALRKARRGESLIAGGRLGSQPEAELAAEVLVVWCHRKVQPHVFGKELLCANDVLLLLPLEVVCNLIRVHGN